MEEINRITEIRMDELDKEQYLQSLLIAAYQAGMIEEAEFSAKKYEIFQLLNEQVEKYNQGQSSSIHVEKAQQLLQNLCYQVGVALKSKNTAKEQVDLLKTESLEQLYQKGHQLIRQRIEEERKRYEEICLHCVKVDNLAYQDTITKGIKEFFDHYDAMFGAFESPGDIDYPLCIEITNGSGIEYMQEYLRRLSIEEQFLKLFNSSDIQGILYGYSEESRKVLVNLFELILVNCIGRILIREDPYELNLDEGQIMELDQLIHPYDLIRLQEICSQGMDEFCANAGFEKDTEFSQYIHTAINKVSYRMKQNAANHTLSVFFLSMKQKKERNMVYQDGDLMPSGQLRKLIEELSDCRYVQDKIALIQRSVRSMEDLVDILNEAIFGEEAREVFTMLSDVELGILLHEVVEENERNDLYHCEESAGWHLELILYINGLSEERQEQINSAARM